MNKNFIIVGLVFLLVVSSVFASSLTEISSSTSKLSTSSVVDAGYISWIDATAFVGLSSGSNQLLIIRNSNGQVLLNTTSADGGYFYSGGGVRASPSGEYLYFGYHKQQAGPSNVKNELDVYRVASAASIQLIDTYGPAFSTGTSVPNLLHSSSLSDVIVRSATSTPSLRLINRSNAVANSDTTSNFDVTTNTILKQNEDALNNDFMSLAKYCTYLPSTYNASCVTVTGGLGNVLAWNKNALDAVVVTSQQRLMMGPVGSLAVYGVAHDSAFTPVKVVSQSLIIGYYHNVSAGIYHPAFVDWSDPLSPNMTILNSINLVSPVVVDDAGNGLFVIADVNNTVVSTHKFAYTATGVVTPSSSTPPNPSHVLMGLDENGQNFVFKAAVTSFINSSVFTAQRIDSPGSFTNLSNAGWYIKFNSIVDLSRVTNDFCPNTSKLIPGVPGLLFGSDGALLINKSAGCLWNTKLSVPSINGNQLNGNATLSFAIDISPASLGQTSGASSIGVFSSNNNALGRVLLSYAPTNILSVYSNEGVLLYNGSQSSVLYVTMNFDFSTRAIRYDVRNNIGTLLNSSVGSMLSSDNDLSSVLFDENSQDGYTEVDYVSASASYAVPNPTYVFYDKMTQNQNLYKAIYYPVGNMTFGSYESRLYATDDVQGSSYYVDPDLLTFTYSSATPHLTAAQIASAIDAAQGTGGFVSGDIVTDKLQALWDSLGFKTTGSKILIGVILVFLATLALSGLGSEVIIFADIVVMLGLTYIGLFPVWFTVLLAIVGAGIFATAMRKTAGG